MLKNQFLDYPEIPSLIKPTKKLVVLIHGLGSDGNDLISLVPYIQQQMPSCHFISPHGVEEYDMAPFGRQWFSLQSRVPQVVLKLVEHNAPMIQQLINQKQNELSLTNKETILVGFSQGAMVSLYLTLIANEPYASTIGFSGALIPPLKITNKSTPICLIHGKEDTVLPVESTESSSMYLTANNINHKKLIIDNLTHSIDDQGLKFALNFLKNLELI